MFNNIDGSPKTLIHNAVSVCRVRDETGESGTAVVAVEAQGEYSALRICNHRAKIYFYANYSSLYMHQRSTVTGSLVILPTFGRY